MTTPAAGRSHPQCWTGSDYRHACQELSGRRCIERGCGVPAGTWWGPHWCPRHDVERLDRIDESLNLIAEGQKP